MLENVQRKVLRIGITAFVAVVLAMPPTVATAGTIPFQVITSWGGYCSSGMVGAHLEVIRTQADLVAFWRTVDPTGRPPDVDLRSHTVIVYYVDALCSPEDCTDVVVERLAVRRGILTVEATAHEYWSREPGPCPCTGRNAVMISTIRWPREVAERTQWVQHDCQGSALETSTNSMAGVEPDEAPAPQRSAAFLRPAFPNPSIGVMRFAVDLPREQRVEIMVCDVAGRRLAQIQHGCLPAGTSSFDWDGRLESGAQAGPGIYFLRMDAEDAQATQCVVRLR